jgi:hypothetical protein
MAPEVMAPPGSEAPPSGSAINYGGATAAQPVAYGKPEEAAKPVTYAPPEDASKPVTYGKPEALTPPGGVYTYGDKPPHVVDEEEKSFKRNFWAGIIGIAAGICFLISGVNGAGFFRDLASWVAPSMGDVKDLVVNIFMAVAAIATLGGILVIGGGAAVIAQRLFTGKILCFIGGGTGLTGLIIAIIMPLWQGSLSEFGRVIASLCTLSGLGTILAIISGFMTKLPVPIRYMLKGKR